MLWHSDGEHIIESTWSKNIGCTEGRNLIYCHMYLVLVFFFFFFLKASCLGNISNYNFSLKFPSMLTKITAQFQVQFDFLTEKSNSLLKTISFFKNCIHESLAPLTRWKISKSGLVNNSQLPTGNCSNFVQGFGTCLPKLMSLFTGTHFTVRHMACFVFVSSFDIVSGTT